MLLTMLKFEWRYYLRQPSFYVTGFFFFLMPFLATTTDNVRIGGGGNVLYNGSFAITQTILVLGLFGMFALVNFVAGTATRNSTSNMQELLYTKPFSPLGYQLGRFLGAYLVTLAVVTMVPVGIFLGSVMPWVDAERLGPINLWFYLKPLAYFILPNLLALGMLFFAIAHRTRSMMGAYLVAMALFIGYIIGGELTREPEFRFTGALLDPFGLRTFGEMTRYWTVFEKNTAVLSLEPILWQSRLLWLGLGAAVMLAIGRMHRVNWPGQKKQKKVAKSTGQPAPVNNNITMKATGAAQWRKFITRTRFEMAQVILSPAFLVLMLFSLFNLTSLYFVPGGLYGTPDWPLTQNMVNTISESFSLMLIIVITYYSGELVWRERSSGMGDIIDSTPAFNLVFWSSKLLAMFAVIISLFMAGMIFTVIYQLTQGYFQFEWGQYLLSLLWLYAWPWCLLAVLAFFIQVLSPNKYMGMLLLVAYFIATLVFEQLGLEHRMWSYGDAPRVLYSDMNGYGWFLTIHNWYMLYWSALALVMATLGYALWQRGPQASLRARATLLAYQLGHKGRGVLITALLVFISSGGYIHYNTKVLNTFEGSEARLDQQADYERRFGQYENANAPVVTAVNAEVDIYPKRRQIQARATMTLVNKGQAPISRSLLSIPEHTSDWQLDMQGAKVEQRLADYNSAWIAFKQPLMPGESREAILRINREKHGFKDRDFDLEVAENGTFINNFSLFPSFGFNSQWLISDRHERRKRDLPERPRAHKLEDTSRYNESFFGPAIGFIDFEITLSTAADQIAIAPGYLQRQWQENGRAYFHYKMDAPMVHFYSILSARLEAHKEEHEGVNIEVYYHPTHGMNVPTMVAGVKDSLDYFSREFGPYQHRQLRIIEFPGYRSFAQSFANTVPYSERIGFIADLRDPEDIDYVYYVTAHEVAHQWWGHQVNAANVQGSAIISETLSQYSAIMVLMGKYGAEKMRKFIKYELDRYLRGRSGEALGEMPLMRAENQSYIHYRKGSVIMMALLDRLGEERLNAALRGLVERFRFNTPYATTLDLQQALKQGASDAERRFIADLFERITLYDIKARSGEVTMHDDGSHTVTLTIDARRFVADAKGQETAMPMEEYVDIVLFSDDPNKLSGDTGVMYQHKHLLKEGENIISIDLQGLPEYAGVDPFVKLIDRDSGDNLIRL